MKKDGTKSTKAKLAGTFLSLASVAVALILAIGLGLNRTLGWLSSNNASTATGMSVRVSEMPYELAVAGNSIGALSYTKTNGSYVATPINDFNEAIQAPDGTPGSYATKAAPSEFNTYYTTSGSDNTIIWRLTDFMDGEKGLGPGSSGSITFYILPKTNGPLTVTLNINLEGYSATVNQYDIPGHYYFKASDLEKIEDTPSNTKYKSVRYLNTHLLFFTEKMTNKSNKDHYAGLIDNGKLELSFPNCTANVLEPVTLYWIWPNTFSQYICISSSGSIAEAHPDESEESDYKTAQSSATESIRTYVINNVTNILEGISEQDALALLSSNPSAENPVFNETLANSNITELSTGYNNADTEIGTNVHYFLMTLTSATN